MTEETEYQLQIKVVKLFRSVLKKTVWFHVPNGEKRDSVTAARLRRMGVRPGVADFIIIGGISKFRYIAIELKTKKGAQSEDQKGFERAWKAVGGEYYICRSVEDVIEYIGGMD